jgi:hypothetical protein
MHDLPIRTVAHIYVLVEGVHEAYLTGVRGVKGKKDKAAEESSEVEPRH